jgi:hypothetical protein
MTSFFDDEKQVVPLITYENGVYHVCDDTLQWLETIGEFSVIACAGKYRTGKSFLLNRLASAKSNVGFGVGDSVQACTKGLWLYKEVFTSHDKQIVFVDTEGIDALDANDTHDVRIFTLALLLSSAFIYNSMGPIDETALQTLSLMTRVTENVRFDTSADMKDIAPHMPKFYWILRDFSLKLTDKDNYEISEDEYLEQALQYSSDPNKNGVREAIRISFPQRTLITLPRPSNSMDNSSQRMEDRLMNLSRSFVNGVNNLRTRLFSDIQPLKANESTVTGKMYAALCKHYVDIVQSDSIPVIKDSWTLLAAVQSRDLKDALIADCAQKLSVMKPKLKACLNEDMRILKNIIIETFIQKSMKPIDHEVKDLLEQHITTQCEEACRRLEINIAESVEKSLQALEPLIDENPEKLSIILNEGLAKFGEDNNNSKEFIDAWMVAASERALCRWIPRSLQSLASERNDSKAELEKYTKEYTYELDKLKEENEHSIREEKFHRSELEQKCDAWARAFDAEQSNNTRLSNELILLASELRFMETSQTLPSVKISEENNDNNALQLQDELSKTLIECAELKSNLAQEKSNHAKSDRLQKESNERLEKAMSMHAQLEQNWKSGIEKLRKELKDVNDEQKSDFEEQVGFARSELLKLKKSYDQLLIVNKDMEEEKKRLHEKFTQESLTNERNISNLRDTAQKYREQSDKAQGRVLEIHRSMLEDLRIRDDRGREQQSKYLKETSQYQQKISEVTRENDNSKSEIMLYKRKLSDLETIEIECKRYKTSDREKDILINQLQVENREIRSINQDMMQEREKIRKENMTMEGELSLLRAEREMHEVRKSIVG